MSSLTGFEGDEISIFSCQLLFIKRENITKLSGYDVMISSIVDASGTGLLEVIDAETKFWDGLNVRFYWDLGGKGEHGVGFTNPRHGAYKGCVGLGMW